MAFRGANDSLNFAFFLKLERTGEKYVIDFCMNEGLISNRYECPKCGRNMRLVHSEKIGDGFIWICRIGGQNAHKVKRSVRKGSWFEESCLSMTQILMITYFWITKATTDFISNELKVSTATVKEWKRFCRGVCFELCMSENTMLGGPGVIVEIDESEFGKRKYSRGKPVVGKWVFCGVERGSKKCFLEVVETRSTDVLLEVIKKYIMPGTTIVSDCWKTYNCLDVQNFVDLTVNHAVILKNPTTGAHTNAIEGLWSAMKIDLRELGHRRCKDELSSYLAEFLWRKLHVDENADTLFRAFLEGIKKVYTPLAKDLET